MLPRDFQQTQVRSISETQLTGNFPHGGESFRTDRWREPDEKLVAFRIEYSSWSEGIPEEVKLRILVPSPSPRVFAIYNLRLFWMHLEATLCKSGVQRGHHGLSIPLRPAVHQPVVSIATPWHTRERSCHPGIERVVQEEVCKNRANNSTLGGSFGAFHQGSIRQLKRRRQPSSNV